MVSIEIKTTVGVKAGLGTGSGAELNVAYQSSQLLDAYDQFAKLSLSSIFIHWLTLVKNYRGIPY